MVLVPLGVVRRTSRVRRDHRRGFGPGGRVQGDPVALGRGQHRTPGPHFALDHPQRAAQDVRQRAASTRRFGYLRRTPRATRQPRPPEGSAGPRSRCPRRSPGSGRPSSSPGRHRSVRPAGGVRRRGRARPDGAKYGSTRTPCAPGGVPRAVRRPPRGGRRWSTAPSPAPPSRPSPASPAAGGRGGQWRCTARPAPRSGPARSSRPARPGRCRRSGDRPPASVTPAPSAQAGRSYGPFASRVSRTAGPRPAPRPWRSGPRRVRAVRGSG